MSSTKLLRSISRATGPVIPRTIIRQHSFIICNADPAMPAQQHDESPLPSPSSAMDTTKSLLVPASPSSLPDLTSLLSQLQPFKGRQASKWDLECDLRGQILRTSTGASKQCNINIPSGTRVRLYNGTLQLPPDVCVNVGPGAALQLDSVSITGPGATAGKHPQALLMVQGAGAFATLNACHIVLTDAQQAAGSHLHCVLVAGGASAQLTNVSLKDAPGHGLFVINTGTNVTADSCRAEACQWSGFACSRGARLTVSRCTSSFNKLAGFWATCVGSAMEVGPGCMASDNTYQGYGCEEGARMSLQQGCTAQNNSRAGFSASGSGSVLEIGTGCTAYSNKRAGFAAVLGAHINIQGHATANANQMSGFCAEDSSSRLETGPGCVANNNALHGFTALKAGHLLVGANCEARGNTEHGFLANGICSSLKAAAGCSATSNDKHGFCATSRAEMEIGEGWACNRNGDKEYFAEPGAVLNMAAPNT